jgi:rRNA maturation protein Nop10
VYTPAATPRSTVSATRAPYRNLIRPLRSRTCPPSYRGAGSNLQRSRAHLGMARTRVRTASPNAARSLHNEKVAPHRRDAAERHLTPCAARPAVAQDAPDVLHEGGRPARLHAEEDRAGRLAHAVRAPWCAPAAVLRLPSLLHAGSAVRRYALARHCCCGRASLPVSLAARFSPDDKFSRHRVTVKKRYGLLPTQGPPLDE